MHKDEQGFLVTLAVLLVVTVLMVLMGMIAYRHGFDDGVVHTQGRAVEEGYGCYFLMFEEDGTPTWEFQFGRAKHDQCEGDQ